MGREGRRVRPRAMRDTGSALIGADARPDWREMRGQTMIQYVRLVGAIMVGLSLVCASVSAQVQRPSEKQAPVRPSNKQIPVRPSRFFNGPPPNILPDLVITFGTVTVKCETNGSQKAEFVATVINQSMTGTADLSAIPWQIILAADWWPVDGWGSLSTSGTWVKPLMGGPMTLKPGEQFTTSLTITGLPHVNPVDNIERYGFELSADPLDGVKEPDEKNNSMLLFEYLDENCVKVN